MTLLCVPIFMDTADQLQRDVAQAAEAGADIIELRLDRLPADGSFPAPSLPFIVTCRPQSEGGESTIADHDRIGLLAASASRAT